MAQQQHSTEQQRQRPCHVGRHPGIRADKGQGEQKPQPRARMREYAANDKRKYDSQCDLTKKKAFQDARNITRISVEIAEWAIGEYEIAPPLQSVQCGPAQYFGP